jgi:CRISPR system Cascade subunit CasA
MVVDRLVDDPIVAIAAPRPDFNGAIEELMIGLLTVALQPVDEDKWLQAWDQPPTRERLEQALAGLPGAFELDGEGPRAFQDLSTDNFQEVDPTPIEQLLVDAAGGQTVRLNKDLFVKRERFERLGRPAAAMALITMQTYAPAGGQGHRTSLRGGGPLTTLVDPRVDDTTGESRAHDLPLWQRLWANVQSQEQWRAATPGNVRAVDEAFPWLSAPRTSEGKSGNATTSSDVHPLQAFFGVPRRIRLEFDGAGTCEMTERVDERTVTQFRMRSYGAQYVGWRHPLSPYYRAKEGAEWLPVHGQPGGVAWRDWVGLVFRATEGALREPAAVVGAFGRRASWLGLRTFRLHAFGYDFDNMKARGWVDASMPVFAVDSEAEEQRLRDLAARLTDATGITSSALLGQIKRARFGEAEDVPGDLSAIKTELWAATERAFYDAVGDVARSGLDAEHLPDERCRDFVELLERSASAIFDRWCPGSGVPANALRRIVAARFGLIMTLRGYSALGEKLFAALRIPAPGGGRTARKNAKRARKETTA